MSQKRTAKIRINLETGKVVAVYDDRILPILNRLNCGALTNSQVRRASHVEPSELGGFDADMRPSNGPSSLATELGVGSFPTHDAAINAEREWLDKHLTTEGCNV